MSLKKFLKSFSHQERLISSEVSRLPMIDMYTALEQIDVIEQKLEQLANELDDINNEVENLNKKGNKVIKFPSTGDKGLLN